MDDKRPIAKHGRFWLIDNEQRQLWGTLYIGELNEAKLETHGSLIETWVGTKERLELWEDIPSHTIVGQIKPGGEWVTLIDCLVSNTQNSRPLQEGETDWSHQACLVSTVVEGIGFEMGEDIAFERAFLDISTLPKWAQPNLVSVDMVEGKVWPYRLNVSVRERETKRG